MKTELHGRILSVVATLREARKHDPSLKGLPKFLKRKISEHFPDAIVKESGASGDITNQVTFDLSKEEKTLSLTFDNFKHPESLKPEIMELSVDVEYELLRLYVEYHRSIKRTGDVWTLKYKWD